MESGDTTTSMSILRYMLMNELQQKNIYVDNRKNLKLTIAIFLRLMTFTLCLLLLLDGASKIDGMEEVWFICGAAGSVRYLGRLPIPSQKIKNKRKFVFCMF